MLEQVLDDATEGELLRVLATSFALPESGWRVWAERIGREHLRVVREGEAVVGGLGAYRFGQWFGGRVVSLAGIAGVATLPEVRGRGLARRMMEHALRELREEGHALAGLYASTTTLYRSVGFEQAGARFSWAAPLASLPRRATTLRARAVTPDEATLGALHEARARRGNGALQRDRAMWQRLGDPRGGVLHAYVVEDDAGPRGYAVLRPEPAEGGIGIEHDVHLRDWVALDAEAVARLFVLFSDLRSLGKRLLWDAGGRDALVGALPEQTAIPEHSERWMLRVLDPVRAVAERGFVGAEGSVDLELSDALFPEHIGRFRLTVVGGRGTLQPGGNGAARIEVRGLAALFSGFGSAGTLVQHGLASGDERALDRLGAMFAAPDPELTDHY